MCLVSVIGIFEYMLDISRNAYLYVGSIRASLKAYISCVIFFMLNVYGSGVNWLNFCVNSFDNLYVMACRHFRIGRIVWLGLCIFMRPIMVGTEGFRIMYFHLEFCGMGVLLWFIVLLM
jgi:hypothetical protein